MFGDWAKKKGRKAHFYKADFVSDDYERSLCIRVYWKGISDDDRDILDNVIQQKDKCKVCMARLKYVMSCLLDNIHGEVEARKLNKTK